MERRISFFCALFLLMSACVNKPVKEDLVFANELKKRIDTILSSRIDSVVNVDDLYFGEWDSLYIFKPYTPIKEINAKIGFDWSDAKMTLINQSDEFNLLLFVQNDRVMKFSKFPRSYGDFAKINSSGPYKKGNAKFIVKREIYGDQDWIFLYPLQ